MTDEHIPFFSYYNRAKREGLTDMAAYHYAITEDVYDPDGNLLAEGVPRPDGMCYHPQWALSEHTCWQSSCKICGVMLHAVACTRISFLEVGFSIRDKKWWVCSPPSKIQTRSTGAKNPFPIQEIEPDKEQDNELSS